MSGDYESLNPFLNQDIRNNLNELLKYEDTREIAQIYLRKLKLISEKFHELSEADKRNVYRTLNQKFSDSVQRLRDKLLNEQAEKINISLNFDYFWTSFSICLIIVSIAFFGYKLYKSLVEKEQKRLEKQKAKEQKKKK